MNMMQIQPGYQSLVCKRCGHAYWVVKRNSNLCQQCKRNDRLADNAKKRATYHPLRLRAKSVISKAKRRGILQHLADPKILCVDCGDIATVYDHRDYAKPLDVDPVCNVCNGRRGPGKNAYI